MNSNLSPPVAKSFLAPQSYDLSTRLYQELVGSSRFFSEEQNKTKNFPQVCGKLRRDTKIFLGKPKSGKRNKLELAWLVSQKKAHGVLLQVPSISLSKNIF